MLAKVAGESEVRRRASIQGTIGERTRQQKERAFRDRDISELGVINDFEEHISFPLVEPFLRHKGAEIASLGRQSYLRQYTPLFH
jgi:hypothetical protein